PDQFSYSRLCIGVSDTTKVDVNNNLYYCPGYRGYVSFADSSLQEWQQASGEDAHSIYDDPIFIQAAASDTATDLHVEPASPVNLKGKLLYDPPGDFDGDARDELSPADIGADAICYSMPINVFAL